MINTKRCSPKTHFKIFILLVILLSAAIVSCENPWMADILDPLLNPTVTFISNGGTYVASIKVQKGSEINKPVNPVKTGYFFGGWYIENQLIGLVEFPYPVNKNITLHAKWDTTHIYDPPTIDMEDGTIWTVRTYNDVYLYTSRWRDENTGAYGESSSSGDHIKLDDIYSGTIDNLIPDSTVNNTYNFRLSGIVDRELKHIKIILQFIPDNGDGWIWLGGTTDDNMVSIGPGAFSEVIEYYNDGIDVNALPDGFVIVMLSHVLVNAHEYAGYSFFSGERIPDDMPDGAVWATISELKIEPAGQ